MRWAAVLFAATISSAAVLAEDRPPTVPATRESESAVDAIKTRVENQQMVREEFDSLPRLPAKTIRQVVHLAIDNGHLHVTALLAPTGDAAVALTDWAGHARINIGAADSLTFHLKHVALFDTDLIAQITEIFTLPDYLQIVRDTESPAGLHTVTLLQSRQFATPDSNPIRVLIHDQPESGPDVNRTITAESFEKLLQTNANDVRHELMPIFKDLGAATLLRGVNLDSAWQVLSADVPPDAAMERKLDNLLRDLASDDFATRAKAEDGLAALGPAAAAVLGQRDLAKLPPDPRSAVDNVLHRAQKLDAATAAALGRDPQFLLDVAAADIDSRLNAAVVARLQAVTGKRLVIAENSSSPEERQKRLDDFRQLLVSPTTLPTR